jgi:hypothetical protein
MPAEAAIDSRNPVDRTSNGSISTSAVTARARCRTAGAGRPATNAVVDSAAMADARSTDGSPLVTSAKKASSPSVTTQRSPNGIRRSAGPATARTKATFSPDTARRWVSPDPRKSSAIVGG